MNRRERSCTQKFPYVSLAQAKKAVRDLKQRTGTTEWIRPYKCDFCQRWHIGRPTKYILSRVQVVSAAPPPTTLNWANVTAKVGPDCEGDLFVHFTDDEGNHAYLTVEGKCHVLNMPKDGKARHGDDLSPHDAFQHLTGARAEDILDKPPGYFDKHNEAIRRMPTLYPDDQPTPMMVEAAKLHAKLLAEKNAP